MGDHNSKARTPAALCARCHRHPPCPHWDLIITAIHNFAGDEPVTALTWRRSQPTKGKP